MALFKNLRPLIVGNWKMNGMGKDVLQLKSLVQKLSQDPSKGIKPEIMLCVPATLLSRMAEVTGIAGKTRVAIGGQDCHPNKNGAHTGDMSVAMLKDAGAKGVILGHSERRANHAETDKLVNAKADAVHQSGLMAIICVGETLKQRKAHETIKVVGKQMRGSLPRLLPKLLSARNTVIAYEPVWAIGTGLTPSLEQIAEVHTYIRKTLMRRYGEEGAKIRILYGGSVNPANAKQILAVSHVNGALVGGASLKAADFFKIIKAI